LSGASLHHYSIVTVSVYYMASHGNKCP